MEMNSRFQNFLLLQKEEKYRKVKRMNPAFQKRVGRLPECTAAMTSIGFTLQQKQGGTEEDPEEYTLTPSAEGWPKLLECKKILDIANAEVSRNSTSRAGNVTDTNTSTAGMMGMNTPPNIEQSMSAVLQNPSQIQSLLQNPMVRQMLQNDPRIANNPMARQSLDMYANNPQLLQQVAQEMSRNPEMLRQVQAAASGTDFNMDTIGRQMQMMQAMNNIPGQTAGTTPPQQQPSPTYSGDNENNTASGNNNNNSNEDSEMTEEEMIAEAIARSLRET